MEYFSLSVNAANVRKTLVSLGGVARTKDISKILKLTYGSAYYNLGVLESHGLIESVRIDTTLHGYTGTTLLYWRLVTTESYPISQATITKNKTILNNYVRRFRKLLTVIVNKCRKPLKGK